MKVYEFKKLLDDGVITQALCGTGISFEGEEDLKYIIVLSKNFL